MTEASERALRVVPATAEHWAALQTLFGPRGAYAGCWCMFWRVERAQFKAYKGGGNWEAFQ